MDHVLYFVDMKKKKRHTLCSWDACSLTQQFHSPILYTSLLITFASRSSSLNWECRGKTRHCDNGILCCGLWLHFPFKPQYFMLWIVMFFVGKIFNLKMLQMAFYQELWTVKINKSNYEPLLWNGPSWIEVKFPEIKKDLTFKKYLRIIVSLGLIGFQQVIQQMEAVSFLRVQLFT